MKSGLFITIEGGEGSGKSTQLEVIKNYLEMNNIPHMFTREPGGTRVGEDLRKILKHADYNFCVKTELWLFNAARIAHNEEIIKPALEKGMVVVCDRYYDSSVAYQGVAKGYGYEKTLKACQDAVEGLEPDMTLWLDITPQAAFERKGGADANDRFEQAGMELHNKVYETYKRLSQEFPQRIVRIDATKTLDIVSEQVLTAVKSLVKNNK